MTKSLIILTAFLTYLVIHQAKEIQRIMHLPRIYKVQPRQIAVFEQVKPLKLDKKQQDCLARNVYYEAGTEDPLGKIAVAQITLNRVKIGYWGKNVCDVVYAPKQFSWTRDDRAYTEPQGQLWKESKLAVSTVVDNGLRIKQLKKGLFYHTRSVSPFWRDDSKRIGQIGSHVFYTGGKDSWLAVNL